MCAPDLSLFVLLTKGLSSFSKTYAPLAKLLGHKMISMSGLFKISYRKSYKEASAKNIYGNSERRRQGSSQEI